jgi:hypothetical protein
MLNGFLPLPHDRFVPIAQIAMIGTEVKNPGRAYDARKITLTDGRELEAISYDVAQILRQPVQLMPSEPGVQLLHFDPGGKDGETWVGRTPIIAWALCADGEIRVVTPSGVDDGVTEPDQGWFVEMPDGRVFSANRWADCCLFGTATEAAKHFHDRHVKRRAAETALDVEPKP